MGVTVATTRVACNTATGNQDITTADLEGLTPKAAWFIVTSGVTDGTAANHAVWSVGAATGTSNRWVCTSASEHGVADVDSHRHGTTDECVLVMNPVDGSVEGEADFVAFITNGVRINWGNALGSAYLLTVVLFAGTDVSAHAGTFTLSTQDTGVDVTAPGFEPDLVLAATECNTLGDIVYDQSCLAVGACTNDVLTTQNCWFWNANNGAVAGAPCSIVYDNRVCCQAIAGVVQWTCELSGFDASGFTATARDGASGGDLVGYLALNFNGAADVWTGVFDSPTSTGDDAQTGPGFRPQFVMLGTTHAQVVNTIESDADGGAIGLSVFDGDDAYSNAAADEDAADPTDTQSLSDDRAVNLPQHDGTAGHVASFASLDASGWTLNFSATLGAARKWWGVAIETAATTHEMAAAAVATSATPDDVILSIQGLVEFAAVIEAASATPDDVVLTVGVEYYVATDGNDDNPGTEAEPFLTIQHAASVADTPGDTVIVRQGTYDPFWIRYSGAENEPITFRNYSGEIPTITGVSGNNIVIQAASGYQYQIGYLVIEGFVIADAASDGIEGYNVHNLTIRDCDIYGSYDNGVIITGSHHVTIDSCCIHLNGFGVLRHGIYATGRNWTVKNSIFYGDEGFGLHVAAYDQTVHSYILDGFEDAVDWHIAHNTFALYPNRSGVILWDGNCASTIDQIEIVNNIFYRNGEDTDHVNGVLFYRDDAGSSWTNISVHHSVYYGDEEFINNQAGIEYDASDNTEADPKFAHVDLAVLDNCDFHLQSDSPAIDAGSNEGITEDYEDNTRPAGAGYDIGAYEYAAVVHFLAALSGVSAVSATIDLDVSRAMQASITAASTTPDDVSLSIEEIIELSVAVTAVSSTPTVALVVSRPMSAVLAAGSATPDNVNLLLGAEPFVAVFGRVYGNLTPAASVSGSLAPVGAVAGNLSPTEEVEGNLLPTATVRGNLSPTGQVEGA